MALLPAQAGADLLLGEWASASSRFTAEAELARASRSGSPADTPAASENPFSSDRAELSGQPPAPAARQNGIERSSTSGVYRPRAALELAQTVTVGRSVSGLVDAGALRTQIGQGLSSAFGLSSPIASQFSSLSDWMDSAHPQLYQSLLVLLQMMMEEDPEKAGKLLDALDGLRNMLSATGGAKPNASASATLSVFQMNVEASLTAVRGGAESAESGSAVFSAASLRIRVNSETVVIELHSESAAVQQGDPLVLDLDGDGINLRSAEEGVRFDIAGDGVARRTAFIQGDDALLYLDQNGNGLCDLGSELFGDQEGDAHGFAKLARYDENGDHVIDAQDSIYRSLRLFQDRDGDGKNSAGESLTLAEAGVERIHLAWQDLFADDGKGNTLAQVSHFVRSDGSSGLAADALLRYYR